MGHIRTLPGECTENIRGRNIMLMYKECDSGRYLKTYEKNIQGTHRGVYNGTYTYITRRMYREHKGPENKLMYREHKKNIHNQGVYSLDIHNLIYHYVLRLFTGHSLRTYMENFQGTFVGRSLRTYEDNIQGPHRGVYNGRFMNIT